MEWKLCIPEWYGDDWSGKEVAGYADDAAEAYAERCNSDEPKIGTIRVLVAPFDGSPEPPESYQTFDVEAEAIITYSACEVEVEAA